MKTFTKQLIFLLSAVAIITTGVLVAMSATPSGFLKIKPSLTPKIKMAISKTAVATPQSVGNPVGWWKMDEGTATTCDDASGNGNTGQAHNFATSTMWTTGKLGKGLSFDGVDDYVDTGSGSSLNITGAITISAWVKGETVGGGWKGIVGSAIDDEGFFINALGKLGLVKAGVIIIQGNTVLLANTFYHTVLTYDGTTIILYLNGVNNGSVVGDGSLRVRYIGADLPSNEDFNGTIDDVRIYNRALSAGEVAQMWNSTKDGYLGNIIMHPNQ